MKTPRGGKFWGVEMPTGHRHGDMIRVSEHNGTEPSDRSPLVLPSLKVQPRIPTFGPASQLSPMVLISSVASHGFGNSSGRSPRKAPNNGLQTTLPSLTPGVHASAGAPFSARGGSNVGASQGNGRSRKSQSCEPRLQRQTAASPREPMSLRSRLHLGDQSHRLPDYPADVGESRAQEDVGTPAPLSSAPSRGPYEYQTPTPAPSNASPVNFGVVSEIGQPNATSVTSPTDSYCTSPRESAVPRLASIGENPGRHASIGENSGTSPRHGTTITRHATIRACFHMEEKAIEAAMLRVQRFQNTREMEMRNEKTSPKVASLLHLFESSGLAARPQRKGYLRKEPTEDPLDLKIFAQDTASSTEISTCAATLNFYRSLCGLPLVRLSSSRLAVCNIISVALLARATPSAPLSPDSGEFVEALTDIIGSDGTRVSVLHGEASLISAVEASLASTHTLACDAVAAVQDVAEHANFLAEQIGLANPGALAAPSAQEKRRPKKISARAPSYDHEAQPMVLYKELPEPLRPLRVLWDLQAGIPKDAVDTIRKSKPLPSKTAIKKPIKSRAPDPSSILSSIWGDRHGALAFRRSLLSPALREFGVARRHDTSILWTGTDHFLDDKSGHHIRHKRNSTLKSTLTRDLSSEGTPHRSTIRSSTRSRSLLDIDDVQHAADERSPSRQGDGSTTNRSSRLRRTSSSKQPAVHDAYVVGTLGAVCWPPSGIVPLSLVLNRRMAWTIMPDGSRYQPTESTQIRVWKVQMDRPIGGVWSAERLTEVPVKNFAIDCSSVGEPFCAIFWPDFGPAVEGCQLEVELSGLRGDFTKLNFFYEFKCFLQKLLDEHLCAEAATFRAFIGDRVFWGPPRDPECIFIDKLDNKAKKKQSILQRADAVEKPHDIKIISYQEKSYNTNGVDVTIVLQSDEVEAMYGELNLVRFSGEMEGVPCAATVQKLPEGSYFIVRVKLPMSRQRFEIRLFTSSTGSADDFKVHPLRYLIGTNKDCPNLLSTLEDPRKKKFGYCQLDLSAQLNGIVVIAPVARRIVTANCYFLVYIDKSVALEAAKAELEKAYCDEPPVGAEGSEGRSRAASKRRWSKMSSILENGSSARLMRLYDDRLQVQDLGQELLTKAAQAARSAVKKSADTVEEEEVTPPGSPRRATPVKSGLRQRPRISTREQQDDSKKQSHGEDSSASSPTRATNAFPSTVAKLQHSLRAVLEKSTQDAAVDIALELSLRGGEVVYRLRERADFPGLYECLVCFGDMDVESTVQLFYRFPIAHSCEYAPRKLAEWFIVRDEQLSQHF